MYPSWKENIVELFRRLGFEEVEPFSRNDFGRDKNDQCVSVVVKEPGGLMNKLFGVISSVSGFGGAQKEALKLIDQIRPKLPIGTVVFIGTTRWLGDFRPKGVELVVGPGEDQFDILRLAKSDAANYDLDTEALIAKLKSYHEKYGIDIYHAETDTIQFRLPNLPADMQAFAEDLYEFCPDIVDQGCESTEVLAAEISKTKNVYLWWD